MDLPHLLDEAVALAEEEVEEEGEGAARGRSSGKKAAVVEEM